MGTRKPELETTTIFTGWFAASRRFMPLNVTRGKLEQKGTRGSFPNSVVLREFQVEMDVDVIWSGLPNSLLVLSPIKPTRMLPSPSLVQRRSRKNRGAGGRRRYIPCFSFPQILRVLQFQK